MRQTIEWVIAVIIAAAVWAFVIWALGYSLAGSAKAQINPESPAERMLRATETTAHANTGLTALTQIQVQTLQTLVVAEHAQACLMANDQRFKTTGFWGEPSAKGLAAEMAWTSLNCQEFFEATSQARRDQAVKEAQ